MEFDLSSLPFGTIAAVVFLTRMTDVALGTIRTIATVQGRTVTAFVLGLFEVTMWLLVITAVINMVTERPWLIIFYAFGFSTGNVVGIWLERRLAMGFVILRIITGRHANEIIETLREADFRVTRFEGEGLRGPVSELYVVCERKELNRALQLARKIDKDIFFLTETPGTVRRFRQQRALPFAGWRSVAKRK
ncbi:MAG: DUF2179 domain-containing protein [Verrucomicrobiota bacterium]